MEQLIAAKPRGQKTEFAHPALLSACLQAQM
jgi:hypothetical protein